MRDNDLRECLRRIDHKGYPAYKDTRGQYQFADYVLCIDHVQGDPFAAPSKVRLLLKGKRTAFDAALYNTDCKRIALQDYLLRRVAAKVREFSFRAKGSGKSGLISISQPGQEILERSALVIAPDSGDITLRLEIGFPANGRTINARELEKILFDFLPVCVKQSVFAAAYKKEELEKVVFLAEDQQYIRNQLKNMGLVAFVANGSVLPRRSGVSRLPMKEAIVFQSPEKLEVELSLPHHGSIKGMGIRKGVTLVVGGGYHGKSTLLKALELGVYNHIAGDGREYVITDDTAMKLRAEDGRDIQKADISLFIHNLPNGKDTESFYSEDASGSTSQAANTVEAMEAGASVFLIDEDTSATNFMIRDALMQQVVHPDEEPIIPFVDRIRMLYEEMGISTILVAGSSGSYFEKADCIIQMNRYEPIDITEFAREEAIKYMGKEEPRQATEKAVFPSFARIVCKDDAFARDNRIKTKVLGIEQISMNKENVDLRYVEQLVDTEQLMALALILKHLKQKVFDGKRTVQECVEQLYSRIEEKGFEAFCDGSVPGNLVIPRKQEIYAMVNRCRGLLKIR